MRTPGWIALALATGSAALASADDRLTIGALHGSVGGGGPLDSPSKELDGPDASVLQARAVVSWEEGPVAYPEPRGYAFRGQLVPELMLGALFVEDGRDTYLGAGLRLEAAFAQRRMGLLQVSARGGFFLAARAGLLADGDHTPLGEVAFGEYFWLGPGARLGFELGLTAIADPRVGVPNGGGGGANGATARLPWAEGDGTYLTINAALTLGCPL